MEDHVNDGIELEVREHSDTNFYPNKCPFCHASDLRRHTYKVRTIQDLGSPCICRRIRYERVYFKCKKCGKVFGIEHPLIPIGSNYMPGVIEYAISRILKRGDSIRRVVKDLQELHHVDVSIASVERWVNKRGHKNTIKVDLKDEGPPEHFSGFISIDGTFKAVKTKKNDPNLEH
jgi:transposase